MDRRTFLSLSLALPGLGQTVKPGPPGTQSKPAAPASQGPKPVVQAAPAGVPWTQWGGPHRNFQTEATGLKDTWPAGGPPVVWKRPIGEGYSSPAVENGVLYTMYGKPREEFVLAASAETGKTIWEQSNADDVHERRRPGHGERSLLHAARRRRSLVHHRRRRPSAMPRQENRQAALGPGALGAAWRLAPDVRLRVQSDRVPRDGDRPGRRPRQGVDGVPAGGRQTGVGEERFRQRLLVADADRRRRARAAGRSCSTAPSSASIRTTAICSGRCRSRRTTRSPFRRRSGVPTTCCSSRPSTTPAAR